MTKKTMKHKPPSRIRYERTHPTVSVRVSEKIKSTFDEIRAKTGHSYGEIVVNNNTINATGTGCTSTMSCMRWATL